MSQKQIPFSKSLNPIDSIIRHNELLRDWKLFKKSRRQLAREFAIEVPSFSFREYLRFKGVNYSEYLNKPVNKLKYHQRFARYKNNVAV